MKIILNIHVGADIFLFLFDFFYIFHVQQMLRFDKAIYLSFLLKPISSERLSNSLWGSDVLLFLEFLDIVFILYYIFIKLIILLYIFSVISFARYNEYFICLISFLQELLSAKQANHLYDESLTFCCFYWKYSSFESIES